MGSTKNCIYRATKRHPNIFDISNGLATRPLQREVPLMFQTKGSTTFLFEGIEFKSMMRLLLASLLVLASLVSNSKEDNPNSYYAQNSVYSHPTTTSAQCINDRVITPGVVTSIAAVSPRIKSES